METDKLETEEDFIYAPRHGNSINALREKYPHGCPDHLIASVLRKKEEDIKTRYVEIISLLRQKMDVE
jgi:hypothetical protein